MALAEEMLQATPAETGFDQSDLAACIRACFECAQACTACADACLGEDMVGELRRCITLDVNCADVCLATGKVLSRQTQYDPELTSSVLAACSMACSRCAEECEKHASVHEHCRICAEACRRCQGACRGLIGS